MLLPCEKHASADGDPQEKLDIDWALEKQAKAGGLSVGRRAVENSRHQPSVMLNMPCSVLSTAHILLRDTWAADR